MIKRHDAFQEVISQAQSNDFYGPYGTQYIDDLQYQGVYYICLNGIVDSSQGSELSLASPTNLSDNTCSIGNGDGSCDYVFTTTQSARFCPCAESPSAKGPKSPKSKGKVKKFLKSLIPKAAKTEVRRKLRHSL